MLSPNNSYEQVYIAFMTACSLGATEDAAVFISESFTATLPGTGVLTYSDFIQEVDRQRRAFSDLGRKIKIRHVASSRLELLVRYAMDVTFDGILRGIGGQELRGDGRPIHITAVDILTFSEDGKIDSLEIVSDRLATMEQFIV